MEQFGEHLPKLEIHPPFGVAIPLLHTCALGRPGHMKTCITMVTVALSAMVSTGTTNLEMRKPTLVWWNTM